MSILIDWKQATPYWERLDETSKGEMQSRLQGATDAGALAVDSTWGDRWLRVSVSDPWRVIPQGAVLNLSAAAEERLGAYAYDVRRDMLHFLGEAPSAACVLRIVASNGDLWERENRDAPWMVTPA